MNDGRIGRAGLVRLLVLAVLLVGVVGLSLGTQMTDGNVVAAKGKGHGHSGGGPKKEKKPKSEKAEKSGKDKKDKKPKKGHHDDAEPVAVEPVTFVVAEQSTVAAESPTASANDQTGAIVVQGFSCPFVVVTVDSSSPDWFDDCTQPALGTTFELTALDGDNAGWQRTETVDESGVLQADGLASGHYRLVQIDADWCHAESDAVDDQGNVVVTAGERASVWIFTCAPPGNSTLIAT